MSVPPISTPGSVLPESECGEQVRVVMNEFSDIRGIQSAFNAFMIHDDKYNEMIYSSTVAKLEKIFHEAPRESVDAGIRQMVIVAGRPGNGQTVLVVIKMLETLITKGVIPARSTCEILLESERMYYKNTKFWLSSFSLIRKVIDKVDYKGVREVMKTCLDKVVFFPVQCPQAYLPQLNALVHLLEHIFDRHACLLPAYFIVNEVLKCFPQNKNFPHWGLNKLLATHVDSFRPITDMVSVIGRGKMMPIVEHSGHPGFIVHSWKLDPQTLGFVLKGNLPYDPELQYPQDRLLRYILEQPYSRDMACAILGLQKQQKLRCKVLEERLVELVVLAMEKTESEMNSAGDNSPGYEEVSGATHWLWQHLSTQLIFFVLFQFASFPHIVNSVHSKLNSIKLFKGRDFLMWILLQFISGSIQKNPLSDFLPVLRLFDLLYPEREPLPIPDMSKSYCTSQMAPTCIWIHILKKAQLENSAVLLPRPLPVTLKNQYEFLQKLAQPGNNQPALHINDYRIALLCNAFSTNQELFSRPMAALVEAIHGSSANNVSPVPVAPLPVQFLDSLTVHTKMSLIHNIVTHIMKVAQSKTRDSLAPALVETYARLLVYMEIESLGIKGFIAQLLPAVYKSQAWGILHTLLEMFCYRLHHIQPHYRIQLLTYLHNLATNAHANVVQLHLCVEMTALRLIIGFDSNDVYAQLSRSAMETKHLVSQESEELNRALVLTIARTIHVTGNGNGPDITGTGLWFKDVLGSIMQSTPHNWSTHTLQCFPPALADYFQQNQVPKENKQQLKNMVEEEYRNWNAMSNKEVELIEHFASQKSPPLFLCIVWKMILETDRMNPVAFKILERIGPKGLSAHLRKFCDYVVSEFANAGAGNHVNKLTDAILNLVWKFHIVPFDRFLLCMALRTQEGNEAQVCFFIIHLLMVKPAEFRNRIQDFVKENSPDHWKQANWHEKHLSFNSKFPETFLFEDQSQNQFPVLFGNVCLRFLPVFDLVIHRYLEINIVGKSLEMILEHMGALYKFHDRPLTYLYNTLHYYESRLRDKPLLKKKLVSSILGSLREIKPPNWALTDQYMTYMRDPSEEVTWCPDIEYYASLIARFVEVVEGRKRLFNGVDWRYNEFPNPAAHVLHSICVEILALPTPPTEAATNIMNIVLQGNVHTEVGDTAGLDLECWFNAAGLVLVYLPEPYWLTVHDKLIATVESLTTWTFKQSPLMLFSYKLVSNNNLYSGYVNLLGLAHAMWHHLGSGHIHHILALMTDKLPEIITGELQLLFICYLVGPFLHRFNSEKPQMVCRLAVAIYDLLGIVDKATPQDTVLKYMDVFCDLMYHIKYMFTGDIVKTEVEAKIRNLRPALRLRLRFVTHLNMDDVATVPNNNHGNNSNNNILGHNNN